MTSTLDIKAKAPFPAGALSNFAPHAFTFDGVACASMEGLLLGRAYRALFDQSKKFRDALAASGDARLTHSFGKTDPTETILTTNELCSRLERFRRSGVKRCC